MKQNTVNYEVSLWIVLRTPLNERVVVASRLSTQPKYRKRKREQKKTQKTRNKCQTHNFKREFTKRFKRAQAPKTAPYHTPPPTQISKIYRKPASTSL